MSGGALTCIGPCRCSTRPRCGTASADACQPRCQPPARSRRRRRLRLLLQHRVVRPQALPASQSRQWLLPQVHRERRQTVQCVSQDTHAHTQRRAMAAAALLLTGSSGFCVSKALSAAMRDARSCRLLMMARSLAACRSFCALRSWFLRWEASHQHGHIHIHKHTHIHTHTHKETR
jgi:hypothetical protein